MPMFTVQISPRTVSSFHFGYVFLFSSSFSTKAERKANNEDTQVYVVDKPELNEQSGRILDHYFIKFHTNLFRNRFQRNCMYD